MFNRKKNETALEQSDIKKEEKYPRYPSSAGMTIEGFDGEARVKEIGITRCTIQSVTYAALLPDEVYNVYIIPEPGAGIESFSLKLSLRSTKSSEALFEASLRVVKDQSIARLSQYVDYLSKKGS